MTLLFGWWLYSFISLIDSEFELEKEKIELTAINIEQSLLIFLKEKCKTINDIECLRNYSSETIKMHDKLNQKYKINTILSFNKNSHILEIKPSLSEINKLEDIHIRKQRAYFSEVLFLGLLVIVGSFWFFRKLSILLNLNKLQNNFLLSITHELKTPITAIKLSSETLLRKNLPDDKKLEIINQTLINTERLNNLVDNVLLATNIDGKLYELKKQPLKLNKIIENVCKEILVPENFNGILNLNLQNMAIDGDELSLKIVFSNLISNALKYAGKDATINIYSKTDGAQDIVYIEDNGVGIPKNEINNIFNKFYRMGDENTRASKGTGLGLYLVKEILKLHKAKIEVFNLKKSGTCFKLTF